MANVTITPSNVVPPSTSTTQHLTGTTVLAAEAIDAGEAVCLFENALYLGDASDTDKLDVKGIAGNSATAAGQRLDVIVSSPALAVGAHAQAVATPLFLSSTPGKLCPLEDLITGDTPVLVAYAATSTTLEVVVAKSSAAIPA